MLELNRRLTYFFHPTLNAGVTQLVECNLAKVDVEGSNPFARSIFPLFLMRGFLCCLGG